MNQADLRLLADERIKDAKALLAGQRWSFAYYTTGYAVECALKSCVLARMVHTGLVFEAKVPNLLTHDFAKLIEFAGLKIELDAKQATAPAFKSYWLIAPQWHVETRYTTKLQTDAEALYEAVTHDPEGVLPWLRTYW